MLKYPINLIYDAGNSGIFTKSCGSALIDVGVTLIGVAGICIITDGIACGIAVIGHWGAIIKTGFECK